MYMQRVFKLVLGYYTVIHRYWTNQSSYILRRPQNFAKSSPYFWLTLHRTKVRWRFCKMLWPSQTVWTLLQVPFWKLIFWHHLGVFWIKFWSLSFHMYYHFFQFQNLILIRLIFLQQTSKLWELPDGLFCHLPKALYKLVFFEGIVKSGKTIRQIYRMIY